MAERFAPAERLALADALLAAGPDAPTLCEGWATRDLAAHLVLRERRPDAGAGIVLKPLAGHTKRVQDHLASGDYPALVDKVRHPLALSPVRLGAVEEAMNLVEFFVHHEDVRRGTPGWTVRELPEAYERALLGRARLAARLSTRGFPATIAVRPTRGEPFRVGAGGEQVPREQVRGERIQVEVGGAPGELLLFFTGRQRAADVELTGPVDVTERLRGARLGL
jgi:uncharacterized protein (TIGR03085 family)